MTLGFPFVQSYMLKISKNLTTFGVLLDQNMYSDSNHVLSVPNDFYHIRNGFQVFRYGIPCEEAIE